MLEAPENSASTRGFTPKAIFATLLVTLVAGVLATFTAVLDGGENRLLGVEALPIPSLLAFVPLLVVTAIVAGLARARLFTKSELVCVLFASMIATPLMTLGFWRFQLGGLSTILRASDWTKLEALPPGLWPHGDNLLEGAFENAKLLADASREGGSVLRAGGVATLATRAPGAVAAYRLRLELGPEARAGTDSLPPQAVPGRPYLLTALVRARDLAEGASYFVRVFADEQEDFAFEAIAGRKPAKKSPLRPDGFVRVAAYPLLFPSAAKRAVTLEFGLQGGGNAEWREPALYDVRAIEAAYTGFTRVTAEEHARLSLAERQRVVVVPASPFSGAGLRYLLGLNYPLGDWLAPVARLGAFALLVFAATFGLALVYRRQWLESERYALPMARIPLVLLGASEADGGLGERFFANRWLRLGFLLALPWCLLKVARGYYPALPDPSLRVGLKSYFSDAAWGLTWDGVEFKLFAVFFALGLLLELNVLLSLVLGYFAFRLQYWVGTAGGLTTNQDFPYFSQQLLGAYVAYGLLLVFFTRRYLTSAGQAALRPTRGADASSQRAGYLLLLGALVGFAVWGRWLGVSAAGVAVLAGHVVLLGFVAAKFRAECGLPFGGFNHPLGQTHYDGPLPVWLWLPLLGSLPAFGGQAAMLMTLVTVVVLPFGFFNVPGLQVELLEVGRRFGVRLSDLFGTALLGVLSAIVIGGWVYLMTVYGFGAARLPVASDFGEQLGAFRTFNAELGAAEATLDAARPAAHAVSSGRPELWALGFGAVCATAVTLLRQFFTGFWFHPIGLLVGPSGMLTPLWGSLLLAWLVRFSVLRLGGARTVRERLVPAAVGIFFAALLAQAIAIAINAYYFFFNKGSIQFKDFV